MEGLLLVHKASGMTSHDVVRRVRRLCKTRKVGHAGTLDPMATGVLPVAVNEATKALQFLLLADKGYRATIRLGVVTDTQDKEGTVIAEHPLDGLTRQQVELQIERLTGQQQQIPPMYSALKRDGVPLYKLARQGKEVVRQPRSVDVFRFELLHYEPPTLEIEVVCSKGTYIRTLCHDLGQALGCGAHLTALERFSVGPFTLEQCFTLEQAQKVMDEGGSPLLPLEEALTEHPAVYLNEEATAALAHGIAPSFTHTRCSVSLAEGQTCQLVCQGRIKAMARVCKNKGGKRPGDFKLLRVFNRP